MDVNAIYFGDADQSGASASLGGPLNMNGAQLDGEKVQWDDAVRLSDPGLGTEGTDKETYLSAGDTLTLSLDIDSLDEIEVFGVRATSTTTDEGSIKGVSGDPEEPEEPEEPDLPTYKKVFFGEVFSEEGAPVGGTFILDEAPEPNPYSIPALPEGTEPTFENYLDHFVSDEIGGNVGALRSIVFYETDEEGMLSESFRLDAPEGGFADTGAVLAAYYEALEGAESSSGADLMAALALDDALEMEAEALLAGESGAAEDDLIDVA